MESNKQIVRKPFPIPQISNILQELEGITYATALDLNMVYYTIRLDPDSSKICTIILPSDKYTPETTNGCCTFSQDLPGEDAQANSNP